MKNNWATTSLLASAILIGSLGCVEPEDVRFDCFIENSSSSQVKVLLHLREELPPYDSVFIAAGETASLGDYFAPAWASYACEARKVQFIFNDNRGYICTMSEFSLNESAFCFREGKDPFVAPRLPNNGFGSITTITEEDFENAFDL